MSDLAHEAAAGVVEDLLSDDPINEAPLEGEQLETPEEGFEFPDFNADTSGIEELLEPEQEPEPEFSYTAEVEEEEEPAWDDDDEKRQLKSKIAKLEKKAAWESEQRIKVSEKNWREEAARRFPLADVDDINATSRRQMLAKAQEQHNRTQKKLAPVLDALETLKKQAIAEVQTEARAAAEDAWGRPTSGPSVPVVDSGADDVKLQRGNFRTLHDRTLALIKAGRLEI